MTPSPEKISIVIPARNEAASLADVLDRIREHCRADEIIVVDDASTDATTDVAEQHGARVVRHPYRKGNGAAIKTGARAATGEILVFLDGDGQHDPADIPRLLGLLDQGYDMAVGARGFASQASVGRGLANTFYNRLASWMVNHRVADLTSGFRAVRADKFGEFLYLLPNGFSYPTTCTMAFFRAGYSVAYQPIVAARRQGRSHLNPVRDGVRFLLIIFKIGSLYSPLKLFVPVSALFFALASVWYGHTFYTAGRFTNMSALLYSTSLLVFLLGLISEQITQLLYKDTERP
ncbi:glycosyltransferase family 2 protein [Parasulfuritortus cantonensis]|uniref:Glycosyltransferase family 2 protein n=1 Tax=Parasulfuritortus cantonensis TaxID=2528202 RepID=A0A4R1BCL6_9PROT|nr:glycosyltransferase family 2 protein [Parasulfuritortus cantonensis]TCJ14737.1 glycosyltransferase family 2 protein [Parasulfuritortus cantonensis]